MPLFEYVCPDCGHDFEKIVPTSRSRVSCPSCQSTRVEKKLSVFAVSGGMREAEMPAGGCGACGADEPGSCRW